MRSRVLVALACSAMVTGCGGGGFEPKASQVSVTIAWGARSRTLQAPSSALSVTITLTGAALDGTDFIVVFNRHTDPAGYTETLTSPQQAKTGSTQITARFYGLADGTGSVVGTASATVNINSDGTGIGDITTTGTIATVEVPEQNLKVGEHKDLAVTAKDANGALVAVGPGAAFFTLYQNATYRDDGVDFSTGQAVGVKPGIPLVLATVDGKVSAPAFLAVRPAEAALYTRTVITTPTGSIGSGPVAVNNTGVVIGQEDFGFGGESSTPYIWKDGASTALPMAKVSDINDEGQVIGTTTDGWAAIWLHGQVSLLPAPKGSIASHGTAINSQGHAVGTFRSVDKPGNDSGVLWHDDQATIVNGIAGALNVNPTDVNAADEVVGVCQMSANEYRGFFWRSGQVTDLGSIVNGTLRINDSGLIVGTRAGGRACRWIEGVRTDLPLQLSEVDSQASGVNNVGQIAGSSSGPGDNLFPVLWNDTVEINLNLCIQGVARPRLLSAAAINNRGQILAIWSTGEAGFQPILLTPAQ